MSRFFSQRFASLVPYTPGEQPREAQYVKLNTNESPFPPAPAVADAAARESARLQLYSDPACGILVDKLAELCALAPEQVIAGNGSDELLNFAFMAFADEERPLVFPDISYGFYPVLAQLNRIPYWEIPLTEDFQIRPEDYHACGGTVVIANPNAPTGIALRVDEIEGIAASNPDAVVIIDEAYVDFGAESALRLVEKYDNLLVIQTFSKSRSLAGGRVGFAVANAALIRDMNTLRYSTNPYNVNRMSMAAAVAALEENGYYMANCRTIEANRAETTARLRALGFTVLDSRANFIFARSGVIGGEALYRALKARGVLVRHFSKERISDFVRVTIGTREQMEIFIRQTEEILKEVVS